MISSERLFPAQICDSPEWITLHAGPLSAQFDPENLWLRYLRLGNREVLRAIYGAVRDADWGTVAPVVRNLRVTQEAHSFRVEFEAECREKEVDFRWNGTLTGESNGAISFRFEGLALSSFLKNRIGLCVLHPLVECAGQPCQVEDVLGQVRVGEFPLSVSPNQPFRNIRALTYAAGAGASVEVRFHGDVFEMEDQRNWSDASFKTYSTPLDQPFPVLIKTGETVVQEVQLRLLGTGRVDHARPGPLQVTVPWERAVPKPPVGLGWNPLSPRLDPEESKRLGQLELSHLRVDIEFSKPSWREHLRQASDQSEALGVGLHLSLHLSDRAAEELDELVAEVRARKVNVALWLVFEQGAKATPERLIYLARKKLTPAFPDVPIAAGTNAYFAELNRNRPKLEWGTLSCFSMTPQVHAMDSASLIENLGGQADPIITAWSFSKRPIVVSPVTLRPRSNPDSVAARLGRPVSPPPDADPRQWGLLGAVWTLGSLAEMGCTGRVHSLTYYETTGLRGLMDTVEAPDSAATRVRPVVFPMFHVFADLAGFDRVCPVECSQPLRVCGLALMKRDRRRILIGNLTRHPASIRLPWDGGDACVRTLHRETLPLALLEPDQFRSFWSRVPNPTGTHLELNLPPVSVTCIERQAEEPTT